MRLIDVGLDSTLPRRASTVLLLGVVIPSALTLSCCARPVSVAPPSPVAEPNAQACNTFTAALPDVLPTAGDRREVTPESQLTAAYGDPPIALRCGVAAPAALAATSQLVTVDGIDWFPEELTAGWRMTALGRAARVEVTVPAERGPAPSIAADLTPTILATLPPSSHDPGA